MAVLPNYAMFAIARDVPRSVDALREIEGVGESRAAKWGTGILALLI